MDTKEIPEDATFYKAVGCSRCNYKGYSGMTVVSELLMITDAVRPMVLKRADSSSIKKVALKEGMITLRQDALSKVFKGITSIEEMIRAINSEEHSEADSTSEAKE